MSPFPFLNLFLLSRHLVISVAEDVQEFHCSHLPYLVPRASASLRHRIYIRNPTPLVSKSSCSCIILKVFILLSLSGISIATSLQ